MRDSIRRHAIQAAAETVDVRTAVFVERAELLGAVALALLSSCDRIPAARGAGGAPPMISRATAFKPHTARG